MWAQGYGLVIRYENEVCYTKEGETSRFHHKMPVTHGKDADSGSFAVVGDLLVGNADVIQVFESLRGFFQGEAKVDMEGQAQGHYVSVMFAEFQGGGIFRQCI